MGSKYKTLVIGFDRIIQKVYRLDHLLSKVYLSIMCLNYQVIARASHGFVESLTVQ